MEVTPTIFRLYDIRGVAGKDFSPAAIAEYERWYGPFPGINITPDVARAIGRSFGTHMKRQYKAKRIVVGHEQRPFADDLNREFTSGITDTGINVTDIGVALTPIVYFTGCHDGYDGAVNITGSHNVYFFNGFKMMGRMALPVFGDELQVIRRMVENNDFDLAEKPGQLDQREAYADYEKYITDRIKLQRPLKIVVDTGNGSAGLFAENFFKKLGCEVISLYQEVDATFPNHVPDPEDSDSLRVLGETVVREKADLGIGLDADGDRVGCVDEKGQYVDADLLLLALARDVLTRHPGGTILYDVKCSSLLERLIPTFGGRPLMHVTGHAPIKHTLRQDQSIILGGEVSGHMYFVEDYYRIDDGLFAAARLLELLAKNNQPFSQLFKDFPKTIRTPELKLPCADTEKFDVIEKVKNKFSTDYKIIDIDGVRVVFDDHTWALIRASNTSPYLTVRMEADTESRLLEIKNIVADELEKYPAVGDKLNRQQVFSRTGRLGWI